MTPGHARMKAMVQNPEAGFPLCNLGNKLVRVVNGNDLDPATSLYFGYRANVKVGRGGAIYQIDDWLTKLR